MSKKLLLMPFIVMLGLFSGCQTTGQTLYNVVAVQEAVDTAMTNYGQRVQQGLVSVEKQREIDKQFEDFQVAVRTYHALEGTNRQDATSLVNAAFVIINLIERISND